MASTIGPPKTDFIEAIVHNDHGQSSLFSTILPSNYGHFLIQNVHARYRMSSHNSIVARFNKRFILSLGLCPDCLVLDDELNVLPISRGKNIIPIENSSGKEKEGSTETQLKDLKESLSDKARWIPNQACEND